MVKLTINMLKLVNSKASAKRTRIEKNKNISGVASAKQRSLCELNIKTAKIIESKVCAISLWKRPRNYSTYDKLGDYKKTSRWINLLLKRYKY